MRNRTKTKIKTFLAIGTVVTLLIITVFLIQMRRPLITIDEAKAVAEAQFFEARAVDVTLKIKQQTIVYDVQLNNGVQVRVEARSGRILKIEDKLSGQLYPLPGVLR